MFEFFEMAGGSGVEKGILDERASTKHSRVELFPLSFEPIMISATHTYKEKICFTHILKENVITFEFLVGKHQGREYAFVSVHCIILYADSPNLVSRTKNPLLTKCGIRL
jgi:hypothetical protein